MIDENIIIRFYFSSGLHMDVSYSTEKFNDVIKFIINGGFSGVIACDEYGINFSQITHYEKI